jgi:hypothetical protein
MRSCSFLARCSVALLATLLADCKTSLDLIVVPQSAERLVGESVQFSAGVSGEFVLWRISAPEVASVSQNGLATCRAAGTATITVEYLPTGDRDQEDAAFGRATLTCRAPVAPAPPSTPPPPSTPAPPSTPPPPPSPPPSTDLITVSPGTISFTHVIGSSPCPQSIGGFDIRNATGQPVTVDVRVGNGAIVLGSAGGTIPGGNALGIELRFNCATQQSFETDVTVTATSGSTTQTRTVRVRATIQ